MSIKQQIEAASKLKQNRGEEDQDYLKRVVGVLAEVSDAVWKGLSNESQQWFNDAVDAMGENKEIKTFPEDTPVATEKALRSRAAKKEEVDAPAPEGESVVGAEVIVTTARGKEIRGTIEEIDEESMLVKDAEGEEHEFDRSRVKSVVFVNQQPEVGADAEPQVGDMVSLTTKRNITVTGEVVELDDDVVVLKIGDEEVEYSRSRVASIVVEGGTAATDEADAAYEPAVGDKVVAITKRGKEVTGNIVEIEGSVIVIDEGKGEEVEVDMETAKSVALVKETKKSDTATAQTTARGRTTAKTEKPEVEGKSAKIKASDNGGVSVTTRMKEIMCADPALSLEAVSKALKSEKLQFNEQTLQINFKLVQQVIELLKKSKHYR